MANKVLGLIIFALLAASQIYTGPTNVISRRGEITVDYCKTKGCSDGNPCDYVTRCICKCSEQGFDWYSYTAFTDDDLCICASNLIAK